MTTGKKRFGLQRVQTKAAWTAALAFKRAWEWVPGFLRGVGPLGVGVERFHNN